MKTRRLWYGGIIAFVSVAMAYYLFWINFLSVEDSIIYFPIDPSANFSDYNTTLTLLGEKKDDVYTLEWDVTSTFDQEAYLRQDISLLFENGRLIGKLSEWEDQSTKLAQFEKVKDEDSSYFQALSFHHAEIHNGDNISSGQAMSKDEIYIIDSAFDGLFSFRSAENNIEKEWKQILDHTIKQQLDYSQNHIFDHFDIPLDQYHIMPLDELINYNKKPLFSFSEEKTKEIIGTLWEGLYKNYFLGIRTSNGKTIEPFGSTMPLLLFSKDQTHLFVLFETKDGEPIQLIQYLRN